MPEKLSREIISLKLNLSAASCFHRSMVDLEPVVLKVRLSLFAILGQVELSLIIPVTASFLNRWVDRWYLSIPGVGRTKFCL